MFEFSVSLFAFIYFHIGLCSGGCGEVISSLPLAYVSMKLPQPPMAVSLL